MTDPKDSWLQKRAKHFEESWLAQRASLQAGAFFGDEYMTVTDAIEKVAREFAERALRWAVPRYYDVDDKVIAEALAAAEKEET